MTGEHNGQSPLISVAMCTYNGEQFLSKQLESILNQTHRNIEVVIVDDASSDGTLAILEQFSARDSRIQLFQNEKNLGFIRNFERALGECRGDYISLADQDDIWLPHKLETLLREIGDNLLIYSKVSLIDSQDRAIDGTFPRVKRIDGHCALSLIFDNCVTGHACLIHPDLLKQALPLPATIFSHDQWLAVVAAASGRLKASDERLSLYRVHDSNALLGGKSKSSANKAEKNRKKLQRTIQLAQRVVESAFLDSSDRQLLETLIPLLEENQHHILNKKLSRFLLRNSDRFLQLYKNPQKAARKLSRGILYYRLLDLFRLPGFTTHA